MRATLEGVDWRGRAVLELAPGTGIWTEWLLDRGARVSGVDGSAAMVRQMRNRLGARSTEVDVTVADLFHWEPTRAYDGVFTGFFLSHVPRARFASFWRTIASCVAPGGVIGFVDSRRAEESTARDHVLAPRNSEISPRRLDDGRAFRVVKNYYEPSEYDDAARAAGCTVTSRATPTFFVTGTGVRNG